LFSAILLVACTTIASLRQPSLHRVRAHDLTKSRLVTIKEGTHGTGSPCIDGLTADFVGRESTFGLDTSCTDQIHLPPFVPNPRGK
jgi:hypothetical protein